MKTLGRKEPSKTPARQKDEKERKSKDETKDVHLNVHNFALTTSPVRLIQSMTRD